MNTNKNQLRGRYVSPEFSVIDFHSEGVLCTSDTGWTTTGGGGIDDLVDGGNI